MNIFKSIKDVFYATGNNKTIPLEGEMLARAEALYEVKEGNWTPPQKNVFFEDLKAFEKDGTAATPEKKAFFEALEESCKKSEEKSDSKQPELGTDGKAKVYKYRVKTDCTFKGSYRRVGEIIISAVELKVPHFSPVEKENI